MRGRSSACGAAAQGLVQLSCAFRSAAMQLFRRVSTASSSRGAAGVCLAACMYIAAPVAAAAKDLTPVRDGTSSAEHRNEASRAVPLPRLEARYQRSVREVMEGATLYRRLPSFAFTCDPELYLFLVNRPDVVVSTWNLLGVSDIELLQTDKNRYAADDKQGTTAQVDVLFRSRELHVVYAEGSYQGSLMPRKVKGRCVMLLRTSYQQQRDESWTVVHSLDCFVKIDNFGADLLARALHSATTQLADRNFAEVTAFVQNLQTRLVGDGEWGLDLAGRLQRIRPEVRDQFADLVDRVYCSGWDLPDGRGRGDGPSAAEAPVYARGPAAPRPYGPADVRGAEVRGAEVRGNASAEPRPYPAGDPRSYGPAAPAVAMQPKPAARPENVIRSELVPRRDARTGGEPIPFSPAGPPAAYRGSAGPTPAPASAAEMFASGQAPVVVSTPIRAADRARSGATAALRASPELSTPAALGPAPVQPSNAPPLFKAPSARAASVESDPQPLAGPSLVGPSLFDPSPSASRRAAEGAAASDALAKAAVPSAAPTAAAPPAAALQTAAPREAAPQGAREAAGGLATTAAKMAPGPHLFQPAPGDFRPAAASGPVETRAASSDGWRSAGPRTAAKP